MYVINTHYIRMLIAIGEETREFNTQNGESEAWNGRRMDSEVEDGVVA
jgi:hypothetical protein